MIVVVDDWRDRVIRRLRALGSSLSSRDITNPLTAPLQVFVCVAPSASSLVTPGNNLRLGPIWESPSHYGTESSHCTPPTSARGRRGPHSGREHIVRYTIPLFLSFPLTPSPFTVLTPDPLSLHRPYPLFTILSPLSSPSLPQLFPMRW